MTPARLLDDVLVALGLGDDDSVTPEQHSRALAVLRRALDEAADDAERFFSEQHAIERRHGAE